jgi:hypothetical protein
MPQGSEMPTPARRKVHSPQTATDNIPEALRPHLDEYWVLQGKKGQDVLIPRLLNEELFRSFDGRGTAGKSVLWPRAVEHGLSLQQVFDGVIAALNRRGRRYRITVTAHADGKSYLITKRRGLRPPPRALRRELCELTELAREMRDLSGAIEVQALRADLQRRMRLSLEYSRPGRRRKGISLYEFTGWAAGQWRVFPASCSAVNFRGAFASFCNTRGIIGRLETLQLSDGKLAVLRHGETERVYTVSSDEKESSTGSFLLTGTPLL